MNVLLWVLQVLVAVHTFMGAVWKFSSSEQAVPSLKAIPHRVWLSMSAMEMLCSIGLILPAFSEPLAILVPVSATCIAVEMLFFSGVHLCSGSTKHSLMNYWIGVAAVCTFLAYGRFVLEPF